jgi:hypothetical protein
MPRKPSMRTGAAAGLPAVIEPRWPQVPRNTLLVVTPKLNVLLKPIVAPEPRALRG